MKVGVLKEGINTFSFVGYNPLIRKDCWAFGKKNQK